MCRLCTKFQKEGTVPEKAFREIEAAIKRGADPEHFKPLLDKLLGTEVEDQDEEMDEAWERSHR